MDKLALTHRVNEIGSEFPKVLLRRKCFGRCV